LPYTGSATVRLTSLSEKLVEISRTPRQAADAGAHEFGKHLQAGRHHLQLVVVAAREVVAGQHLRQRLHFTLEGGGDFRRVVVQAQLHEAQHAPAREVPIQVGVVAADQSGFLQLPHAPPAGRGRQCHALGQLAHGGAAVLLQGMEQAAVHSVEFVLGCGHELPKWSVNKAIISKKRADWREMSEKLPAPLANNLAIPTP
jgi:hypothetical protein